ncbi:protein translocase SEC6 [Nadsonia fulvescens var. elongata DSM 6958]|uniref:Protein translocase SEC6 n=1 Tax=Nadsonia fulvescens var. elongata DSM 6958 TaxID=857566 RepID=A0A1E3PU08_9ASCO|nr:protein translocase SEC6 [Nadsonia fulvescens var. elongata DSM 6958]
MSAPKQSQSSKAAVIPTKPATANESGFEKITEVPLEFIKEGTTFINKCTKPDKKEYIQIIRAVGTGFLVMGVIGYLVKLIHIPIRHLITV